jgi:hypothetical protein
VTTNIHALPVRYGKNPLGVSLLAGFLVLAPNWAEGHDTLGACVQHSVHLSVGAQNADLTIDLTFFEEWSAHERAAMDADGNGTITRSEQEAYLKRLAPHLCKQVKLRMAGRELPLVPLYDPEIDLLANNKVGSAHHRLRLFFFAATPTDLRAGDEILVADRLWPDAKILVTPQSEGKDGCTVAPVLLGHSAAARERADEPWLVRFKCLKPPLLRAGDHPLNPGNALPQTQESRHNLNR